MQSPRLPLFMAVLLIASAAAAQITVGVVPTNLSSSDANFPTPQTDVSLENPATGAGTITRVTFAWNATCSNVVKIKFFRRAGNTLTQIAERGPFNTLGTLPIFQVTLSPGVDVQAGDLIGITRVASCGNALAEPGTGTQGYVVLTGDATSGTITSGNTFHDRLGLMGTGEAPVETVGGTLAVVGSTAGSFGAVFKTSLQLVNPSDTTALSGRLVFHRAQAPATLSDPQLAFTLAPGQVYSFTDVIAAMGQSGLGSMDVIVAGTLTPIVLARIYNDAGANGTAGFFEDLVPNDTGAGTRILTPGTQGFIITPIEPNRTRLNIGVRTFASGATMIVNLEDSEGHVLTTINKQPYQANYFEQVDASTFLAGNSIAANQRIRIRVTGGSAIVYGSTTDNVTNDPSVQFAVAR